MTKTWSPSCLCHTSCLQVQVVKQKNRTIRIRLKRNYQKDLFLTEYFTRSLKVPLRNMFKRDASLTLPCSDFSFSPDGNYAFLFCHLSSHESWTWTSCFPCPFCRASFKLFAPGPTVKSVYIEFRNLRL